MPNTTTSYSLLAGAPYQHQSITTNNKVSKLIQIQFFSLLGHHLWAPNVSTVTFPGYVSTPHAISTARLETPFPRMSIHTALQDKPKQLMLFNATCKSTFLLTHSWFCSLYSQESEFLDAVSSIGIPVDGSVVNKYSCRYSNVRVTLHWSNPSLLMS